MSGKQVPDRMLAHAARAKGTCKVLCKRVKTKLVWIFTASAANTRMANFSVCRAFWSFWAPKGHNRATAGKIYDNRLRVSCIKEYKRLFYVMSVLKRYSPYSLQVNRSSLFKLFTIPKPISSNWWALHIPLEEIKKVLLHRRERRNSENTRFEGSCPL